MKNWIVLFRFPWISIPKETKVKMTNFDIWPPWPSFPPVNTERLTVSPLSPHPKRQLSQSPLNFNVLFLIFTRPFYTSSSGQIIVSTVCLSFFPFHRASSSSSSSSSTSHVLLAASEQIVRLCSLHVILRRWTSHGETGWPGDKMKT
jgi:hypothetical protein